MGSCKRCGECCKWVSIILDREPTTDECRWMKYHGIKVEIHMRKMEMNATLEDGGNFLRYEETWMMLIPCKCEMLRLRIGEPKARCILKTKTKDLRPENCRMNPQFPWQHPRGCTFFEEEEINDLEKTNVQEESKVKDEEAGSI